jgi:hypothetical protein
LSHPQWIQVPWEIFLGAVALKIWPFGSSQKWHLIDATPSTNQFMHTLERIWAKGQVEAKWRT